MKTLVSKRLLYSSIIEQLLYGAGRFVLSACISLIVYSNEQKTIKSFWKLGLIADDAQFACNLGNLFGDL